MKFGPVTPAEAMGGVTVHTLRQGSLVLKKGTTIGPAEVEALTLRRRSGHRGRAARGWRHFRGRSRGRIAHAVAGEGVRVERASTGRANLFAPVPASS